MIVEKLEIETKNHQFWKDLYDFQSKIFRKRNLKVNLGFEEWKRFYTKSVRENNHIITYFVKNGENISGQIQQIIYHEGAENEYQVIHLIMLEPVKSPEIELEIVQNINYLKRQCAKTMILTKDSFVKRIAVKCAFEERNTSINFVLQLPTLDKVMTDEILTNFRPEQYGLTADFFDYPTEEQFGLVAELMTFLYDDIKRRDRHHSLIVTKDYLKRYSLNLKDLKRKIYYLLLSDAKQEAIGLTLVHLDAENPKSVIHIMSGVKRAYRNLGLTKWLKAKIYRTLGEKYPTIETVFTSCYLENHPMIHINEKLGFKEKSREIEFVYFRK